MSAENKRVPRRRNGGADRAKEKPKASDARALALSSLVKWRRDGKYANLEVASALKQSDLEAKDRALYTALVYGVVERAITLDHVISSLSARKLSDIDDETRTAAELGLYQVLYMDRIPDHAAVSATVNIAPRRSRAFVNALLRSFIRAGKKIDLPDDSVAAMSVKYSVPEALVRLISSQYGDRSENIIAALVRRRPTTLRVNTLRIDVERALVSLGENARRVEGVDDMIAVDGESEAVLDGIARGDWFVQDSASRLAAALLGAKADSVAVDCCAAPGGKSFSIALDMENRGELHSFDLHENKISLIRDGAKRLGIDIITAAARDARTPDEKLIGRADYVLCDVPCSGLGVISKKPDIRYNDLSSFARLPEVQYDILAASSAYVKPGGVLVYSTCTIDRAENEAVFEKFLAANEDFVPEDFEICGLCGEGGMLTFLPDRGEWDGFFVAKARRLK